MCADCVITCNTQYLQSAKCLQPNFSFNWSTATIAMFIVEQAFKKPMFVSFLYGMILFEHEMSYLVFLGLHESKSHSSGGVLTKENKLWQLYLRHLKPLKSFN